MRKLIYICLFLFCLSGSFAQQRFFSGYSIAEGLSQSVVNCIFQDSGGFLWFGTQNGLNRFDGYSFVTFIYNAKDSTSISNNWVYAITEDHQGNLWIGTKGGLNKYLTAQRRFERIRYDTPYSMDVSRYVYDVKCAGNGSVLINTPPVLTICDPVKMTFHHFISPLPYDGSVKDCNIPLLEDKNGNVWMGSTRGLACYSPVSGNFRVFSIDPVRQGGISNDQVTALYQDQNGSLWIGTTAGLNLYQENKTVTAGENFRQIKSLSGTIRAVLGDKSGTLWAGTEGGGLLAIHPDTKGDFRFETFTAENNGLRHNIILSLALDRSDNLWIGTLSGISKTDLKKQKFRLFRKTETPGSIDLAGNVIASIYKDRNNILWIGNWGQGLNLYDRQTGRVEHYSTLLKGRNYIPDNYVHTIFEDSDRNIWIGTRDGLLVWQESRQGFVRPDQFSGNPGLPGFTGLRIFMMTQDRAGDYWIATQNGLFRKKQNVPEPEWYHTGASPDRRISANLVYDVLEDRDGYIWIGTTEGLDRLDPSSRKIRHFSKPEGSGNSLSDNFITALCEDADGNIWIGTSSYVNRYSKRDSTFTWYSQEQGLPGNLIYSIVSDMNNRLWFATGNGLCSYDPVSDSFHSYTVEDGLQSPEFNLGAAFVSRDGEVFFGGMNGFNSFYPDSLQNNPHIPEIAFTSVYTMKKGQKDFMETGNNGTIILPWKDNSLTVEFSVLEFSNPSKNRYMYRLAGIDEDWIDIGQRRFVAFSGLSPGEYILQVKGSNNDGVWNEKAASLSIRIKPPFWASNPAYLFYLLTIVLTVFVIIKRREQQHARDKRLLEDKVRERTLQIEQQKSEILKKNAELYDLNTSKDKFFSIIAHDLRNPFNTIIGLTDLLLFDLESDDRPKLQKGLENIKGSSRQAYELLENLLMWARSHTGTLTFHPEKSNLKDLTEESLDLVSAQAAHKNISINVDQIREVWLPVDVNMIRTVLRNLLTNAIKFTPQNGHVSVGLSENAEFCFVTVRDNGTGMEKEKVRTLFDMGTSHKTKGTDKEPGTGLGLFLCKEFVERHGGTLEVESEPRQGSEFRVILPKKPGTIDDGPRLQL